jgi:hypothetical protein
MPLKKYKLSKKSRKLKKSSKSSKSKKTKNFRSSRKLKKMFKKKNSSSSSSKNRSNLKYRKYQKGAGCNVATVKEPGFNVDTLGSMPSLSIDASTAVIYRPRCTQNSSSQAMIPS